MQRTTLSVSSTPEIMITGTSCNAGSPFTCSSTETPSSSGMTMSSRTTSHGSSWSNSSASAPFSAQRTRCPSRSRLRVRSMRLTRSSSTTRTRPPARSGPTAPPRRARRRQRRARPLPLLVGAIQQCRRGIEPALAGERFKLPAELRERLCPEGRAARLQGVRRPAGRLGVPSLDGAVKRRHLGGRVVEEHLHELAYGLATLVTASERRDELPERGVVERVVCARRPATRQRARQLLGADRLWEGSVQPRREALVAVALHGVRRH